MKNCRKCGNIVPPVNGNVDVNFCSRKCQIEVTGKQTCYKCKQTKDITEYVKDTISSSGHKSICKTCKKVVDKKYTDNNRIEVLKYLLKHPCVDCGETDVRALTFYHRNLIQKYKNVGSMIYSTSLNTIMDEIKKCDVLCANCGRRKMSKKHKWYKYKYK